MCPRHGLCLLTCFYSIVPFANCFLQQALSLTYFIQGKVCGSSLEALSRTTITNEAFLQKNFHNSLYKVTFGIYNSDCWISFNYKRYRRWYSLQESISIGKFPQRNIVSGSSNVLSHYLCHFFRFILIRPLGLFLFTVNFWKYKSFQILIWQGFWNGVEHSTRTMKSEKNYIFWYYKFLIIFQ